MNKKLLSVAIGTALAGSISIAQADVQLYGQVDVSVDSHDCDAGCNGYTGFKGFDNGDGSQKINMNGNFSYFGIKGAEDMGNGLKAIFNVMFAYDPAGSRTNTTTQNVTDAYGGTIGTITNTSTSGDTLSNNEMWLGLSGGFGTFRAGTVTTMYSDHGAMIDPFFGTSLEGNKSGLQSNYLHEEFFADDKANGLSNRTMRYDSPDMNGLGGGVFYTMGGRSAGNTNGNQDNPYGLGVHYKNGNILGFADYVTDSTEHGPGTDNKAWDIGGQFTMGNIGMFGMYERGGLVMDSLQSGANVWHVGGSFKMGNTLAYLAYGQGDGDVANTATDEYSSWTLGVKHNLSTRTSVYAGFNQIDVDGNVGQTDHFGMGMNVKF